MADRNTLCFLLLVSAVAVKCQTETEIASDDEKGITIKEDKVQCVKKFVDWCNNMQYPQEEGIGLSLVSISYSDGTNYYRVFCSSDSAGTNCSRNGSPWFSCAPDHVLTYNGEVLTETTTDVDNDICKTQEKAFNELFLYNMSYDNSTMSVFEKELKSFFGEMLAMRQQIVELQKRLGDPSFMGNGFWGGFDGFPFNNNEDTETVKPNEKTDESNLIERE